MIPNDFILQVEKDLKNCSLKSIPLNEFICRVQISIERYNARIIDSIAQENELKEQQANALRAKQIKLF